MTATAWKLTIKPDSEKGCDPFEWCRRRGLIGLGWSYAYERMRYAPARPLEHLARREGGSLPGSVRILANELAAGDFVWLQDAGRFFLCRVRDGVTLIGPQVGRDFRKNDIGHARNARWAQVPEAFVPGCVQRSLIAKRTIQRISAAESMIDYFGHVHRTCSARSPRALFAEVNYRFLSSAVQRIDDSCLRSVLSPDDYEDIIAAALQRRGWTLIKSSCFRSKIRFEFQLTRYERGRHRVAYVQVKSGEIPLSPVDYAAEAQDGATVFLFSSASDPYGSAKQVGVQPISFRRLRGWLLEGASTLPLSLALRLSLVARQQAASVHAEGRPTSACS